MDVSKAGGGFQFKTEAGAKGWGLTLTGLGLGDASDRPSAMKSCTQLVPSKPRATVASSGRPEASMGGVSSGGGGGTNTGIKGVASMPL